MSITIRLPRHDHYEAQFSKNWFQSIFPNSVISQALRDPDAEEINLTDPSVTPSILDFLSAIMDQGAIPKTIPDSKELLEADRYLNIDLFPVLADIHREYTDVFDVNIVDMKEVDKHYAELLKNAIGCGYATLIQYVFNHTNPSEHSDVDQSLMLKAFYNPNMTRLFLQREIDPTLENNRILISAIKSDNGSVVRILLADSRIDPTYPDNRPLLRAIQGNSPSALEELLKDSRIDPSIHDNEPLALALDTIEWAIETTGDLRILDLLLADPRIDPSSRHNNLLKRVSGCERLYGYLPLILSNPKINPSVDNNFALRCLFESDASSDIIQLLMKAPRFNPNLLDYDWLVEDIPDKDARKFYPLIINHPKTCSHLKKFLEDLLSKLSPLKDMAIKSGNLCAEVILNL